MPPVSQPYQLRVPVHPPLRAAAGDSGIGSAARRPPPPRPAGPPDRAAWYAEPVKVFDNLYYVGMTEYSAWAVTTSAGIILIDTIYDYSVEAEVVDGLRKLGLDPKTIKYAIVSHGHGDHSGGAKYLQDTFGTQDLLSAADWDLMERGSGATAAARHRRHRRHEADARRHHAHAVPHARAHARHDLDA